MMKERNLLGLTIIIVIIAIVTISITFLISPEKEKPTKAPDAIAVIDIQGPLLSGESSTIDTTTCELEGCLKKAQLNSQTVILRIDSPGGTASASYEMYSMAKEFEKPIVSYGRGIVVSGSYLTSLGTDSIIVHPFSEVGGVGAYIDLEKPVPINAENAEEIESISSGRLKTLWEDGILDNTERAFLKSRVEEIENTFQNIVYDEAPIDRPDPKTIVENISDSFYVFSEGGWFNGNEAHNLGLVNEIGNFENSVKIASELANIDRDMAEIIELEPPQPGTFENMMYSSRLYSDNKRPEVYLKIKQ